MTPPKNPSLEDFAQTVRGPDEDIDLARASLAIAQMEYPDMDPEETLGLLDSVARRVFTRFTQNSTIQVRIEALNSVLFHDFGLRGATEDYYDPRNSYLNDVLKRKIGIPVSLSVIYLSVGARAGIALGGTAVPMHFLVRVLGVRPPVFVDCYNGGRLMSEEQVREAIGTMSRGRIAYDPQMVEVIANREIVIRMLTNLKMIAFNKLDYRRAIPVLDRLLLVQPENSALLRERGLVRYRLGESDLAREDLNAYLDCDIHPEEAEQIRNLLRKL